MMHQGVLTLGHYDPVAFLLEFRGRRETISSTCAEKLRQLEHRITENGSLMGYEWDFGIVFKYANLLVAGGMATILLVVSSLAVALPLGLLLCVIRISRIPVLSWLSIAYIEVFRSSAIFVLLIWFYFAFPILINADLSPFQSASLAIGLQAASYFAEVFRAGIQSIHAGQWDAARSIGLAYPRSMRYIILPQAIRRMVPVFLSRLIELIKATSLASAISYSELVSEASQIAYVTFRPIETFTVLAAIYFVTLFTLSQFTRMLEKHLARSDSVSA